MIFLTEEIQRPVPPKGDTEDRDYCIRRERYIENQILQHIQKESGIQVYRYTHEPIPNDFYLIRADINRRHALLAGIQETEEKLRCLNNEKEYWAIEHWLDNEVLPQYTKRKMAFVTAQAVCSYPNMLKCFENEQKQVFVKSVQKDVSACCPINDELFEMTVGSYALHKSGTTLMMVSEPIDIVCEWRFFIVDRKRVNSSTYDDYNADPAPVEAHCFVQTILNDLGEHFVPNFVIDVGFTEDRGYVLIELNDIGTSGRYGKNDWCEIVEAFTGLKCSKPYEEFVKEFDNA